MLKCLSVWVRDYQADAGVRQLELEESGFFWALILWSCGTDTPGILIGGNGQPLDEVALSKALGIDRRVVRRCLAKLVEVGCVRIVPTDAIEATDDGLLPDFSKTSARLLEDFLEKASGSLLQPGETFVQKRLALEACKARCKSRKARRSAQIRHSKPTAGDSELPANASNSDDANAVQPITQTQDPDDASKPAWYLDNDLSPKVESLAARRPDPIRDRREKATQWLRDMAPDVGEGCELVDSRVTSGDLELLEHASAFCRDELGADLWTEFPLWVKADPWLRDRRQCGSVPERFFEFHFVKKVTDSDPDGYAALKRLHRKFKSSKRPPAQPQRETREERDRRMNAAREGLVDHLERKGASAS